MNPNSHVFPSNKYNMPYNPVNHPVYKIGESFTMRNILNIIDKMNAAMPQYEFEPEPICEGGIRVKQYGNGYKTFRLNFQNWPKMFDGLKIEDVDRKLIAYDFTGNGKMCTNFRTLQDAPEWTKDEVKCVDTIVRGEGMKRVRA